MKNLLFIFSCLCLYPFLGMSQTSGVIYYTSISKMERDLPPNMPEDVRKMIPKERKINKELHFNQTAAIFKNGVQEEPDEADFEGDERRRRIRRRFAGNRANEMTYTDLSAKTSIKTRDILGKTFLIEDEPSQHQWKMTGEKKQILDFLAMEATTIVNDSIEVTAWFTPQIPVSVGPADLGGLPGAILEATFDNQSSLSIHTTNIELREVGDEELIKPEKGKKVTQEEFNTIRREKMKERRGSRGNGRQFRARGGE